MFNTKKATANIQKKDVSFLQAGIHTDVQLVKAKMDKTPKGIYFIELTFGKNGATVTHTEFEPTRFPGMSDESFEEKCDKQVSRMLQVLKCFYPEDQLVFIGSTFAEFAKWVIDLLTAANKETLLKVKVVYNKNGYTTLPPYAAYTFIEPMILPEGTTSAITELGIDLFERPVKADAEETTGIEANPFTMGAASVVIPTVDNTGGLTPSNELPF